jgi:hypothetical protein
MKEWEQEKTEEEKKRRPERWMEEGRNGCGGENTGDGMNCCDGEK